LQERGFQAWVVGGCVRDLLLAELREQPASAAQSAVRNDWDIATTARPVQVRRAFRRVIPTGLKHGTVTVLLGEERYEVTTLRAEAAYSDGRHPDAVAFVDDIVADLSRRDFTVNAIAYDPLADELVDPFGGLADLRASSLRAVRSPSERFREDGLRVLRAARFSATLELQLDPATEQAIAPSLDSYARVSQERIRDEWLKAMRARRPSQAFEIMREHGLLGITAPELLQGVVRQQPGGGGMWQHVLRCVDACPAEPRLRLAALLHETRSELADALLQRLRLPNRDRARVVALVEHHQIGYQPAWDELRVRRWVQRVLPGLVEDLCTLARADLLSAEEPAHTAAAELDSLRRRAQQALEQGLPITVQDLAVGGQDLIDELGLEPGPQLGQLLRALLEQATVDPKQNQRMVLLARARELVG
jgi:tRNA nucleotidyltransferase (CCA-adding enzyme)